MKEPTWTVYSHMHVASGRRYVGLTKKTMMARWNQHVHCAERKAGKGCAHFWSAIRKYGPKAFSHEVLGMFDTLEAANAAEERWIKKLGTRGPEKGFNLMKGGAHVPHPIKNPWDRPEYRERVLSSQRAIRSTPEFKTRASISSRKIWDSPGFRERMSSISREVHSRPEVRQKNVAASLGKRLSPETKAKMIAAIKARPPASEETREKARRSSTGRILSPETRSKISAAMSGRKPSRKAIENSVMTHKSQAAARTHSVCSIHGPYPRTIGKRAYCKPCRSARYRRENGFEP